MSVPDRFTADVIVLHDNYATVASVALQDDYFTPIADATGSAKKEPGDVFNPEIAANLAIGRALEKLGRKMRYQGVKQVEKASRQAELTAEARNARAERRSEITRLESLRHHAKTAPTVTVAVSTERDLG